MNGGRNNGGPFFSSSTGWLSQERRGGINLYLNVLLLIGNHNARFFVRGIITFLLYVYQVEIERHAWAGTIRYSKYPSAILGKNEHINLSISSNERNCVFSCGYDGYSIIFIKIILSKLKELKCCHYWKKVE